MLLGGLEVPLWVILGIPTCTLMYWYSTRTFNAFKKSGIPGPKPYPVVGSSLELYGVNFMNVDLRLRKKYGKFVGTYEGTTPVLMVYDGEWIKEAFVKNFNAFVDRHVFVTGGALDDSLISIPGDHWKFSRKMLSPEFSAGKLKKMMPDIQLCVNTFVKLLAEQKGKPVDIRRKTNLLALDVISRTAFGFDAETQTKENNEFTTNALKLLGSLENNASWKEKIHMGLVLTFVLMAPDWLTRFVNRYLNVGLIDPGANAYFVRLYHTVVDERRKGEMTSADMIQTLATSVVEANPHDPDTLVDSNGRTWTKKGMTEQEVIGNAMLFLFAGSQTTADTMFYLFYELAQYPEIQQAVYEEITSVCKMDEVTHEQLHDLKYLDRCIQEVMRLYPQGFRFDRIADRDIEVKDVFVEKGTVVTASSWVIHRDPEIWDDPEEFDPDRFLPERMTEEMSVSFLPFGIGNRMCIGSRLALMEIKMAAIATLKKFTIEKNEQTPPRPLEFQPVVVVDVIVPKQTIMLDFKERGNC